MARILIVTQGALAEVLADSARTIAGQPNRLETLSLPWDESPGESERRLGAALGEAANETGDGVLILTDLPGGTPFNLAKKFARADRIEVLSGVNLSMVVRLCCPGCEDRSVGELAEWLQTKGRQSIRRACGQG